MDLVKPGQPKTELPLLPQNSSVETMFGFRFPFQMKPEFCLSAEAVKSAPRLREKYPSGNITLSHNHKILNKNALLIKLSCKRW